MPLAAYCLTVGEVVSYSAPPGESHAYIHIDVGTAFVKAQINVRSFCAPHTLMYLHDEVSEELSALLSPLTIGIHEIGKRNQELALDYLRDYLMDEQHATCLPYRIDTATNPITHLLHFRFQEKQGDQARALAFIWGNLDRESGDGSASNPYLLHDVHMNQGSTGHHEVTNGVSQDGGLVYVDDRGAFHALYLAFATQAWDTDDRLGNAISLSLPDSVVETESVVRIIAARLSQPDPEANSDITLINRSDQDVNLNRWFFANHEGVEFPLSGHVIAAGECLKVPVRADSQLLREQGGVIRLCAEENCVVHEVSYKEPDSLSRDWTLLFQ